MKSEKLKVKNEEYMTDCDCLIHPFQNDPGTSQRQRVIDELLSGAAKIDGRTLADLLGYFVQLSRHINYYDPALNVSDWQPFFSKSIPFSLAAIINYPLPAIETSFTLYNSLFEKKSSSTGLQLTVWYLYYRFIHQFNSWHLTLKGSGLPAEARLEALIRNKLQDPVKKFIQSANAAVKTYGIKRIEFTELFNNKIWNIDQADLYSIDTSFSQGTQSKFKKINKLYGDFKALYPVFEDAVKTLSAEAEDSLENSFTQLKDEFQQNHKPHLALLFVFLSIFRQLQDDLNKYTRRHLDFFYRDILKFTARDANPDKAFVVFEIQKQLEKYLIKKGLKVKDGKDEKKQEILFSLDDEIVVNKAQVAEKRALFINNQIIQDTAYVEGVYMAPDLTMADGIDKPFKDDQPKNFPTMGSKNSKYLLPGTNVFKPYPNARLGFILASPVLLLKEGTRKVTITLQCELDEKTCSDLAAMINPADKGCCGENEQPVPVSKNKALYPNFLPSSELYNTIQTYLNQSYYYISEDLIQELIKKGIGKDLIGRLRDYFLTDRRTICYCETESKKFDNYLEEFKKDGKIIISDDEIKLISPNVKKRHPLRLLFSGEKDWIEPNMDITTFSIVPNLMSSNKFSLVIETTLKPDLPAVTFYNGENLKEDFDTTLPLVKIELDDHFKIKYNQIKVENNSSCCLEKKSEENSIPVSLYHFLRNVKVSGSNEKGETQIEVQVCGLKNFIVKNDVSVLDVHGQIFPFGSNPKINSNFYIGSEEIFIKTWKNIYINLNWKDKPDKFIDYYVAYQTHLLGHAPSNVVEDDRYKILIAILQDGNWIPWKYKIESESDCDDIIITKRKLFQTYAATGIFCTDEQKFSHQYSISRADDFISGVMHEPNEKINYPGTKKFDDTSRYGFIRITLKCQDFQHEIYPFILARQMMAFGKLPQTIDGAVYYSPSSNSPIVFDSNKIKTDIDNAHTIALRVNEDVNDNTVGIEKHIPATGDITGSNATRIRKTVFPPTLTDPDNLNLKGDAFNLHSLIHDVNNRITEISSLAAIIPNEPWTPQISNMELDYTASATAKDISLIHLYPFTGTFKKEEIELKPTLLPTFCDEGTLFLGLKDLVPGNNLNVLFQLAEATSDSESEKEFVLWHYLDNNIWKPLRTGFEVVEDGTKNLTTSGIIKFALPENMTRENSVMPKGLHWIKASIAKNSKAVSETVGIHAQAMSVTFTNDEANDKLRLSKALPAESIAKLEIADASVKSVTQPYDSFGGLIPETEGPFYVRVSERLRHKGRAIQAFDYERLVLEAFPQLYKVKCINHSFALDAHRYINDYPYAPGYIILAVIPDLNKLKAGNSFEPRVPVSIIEDIDSYIRKRTSPFVRFRAMNPRYEKVNFCIKVRLVKGKDENYYREKLRQDLREFLAPWAIGVYDKLTFGQCVYRSDIIRLLETRAYIDFIYELIIEKKHESPPKEHVKICPDTPRSILIAGDIDVCIENPECESWNTELQCEIKPVSINDYCREG